MRGLNRSPAVILRDKFQQAALNAAEFTRLLLGFESKTFLETK
jgi:hypothetical protein